jgi:hypothetical protein
MIQCLFYIKMTRLKLRGVVAETNHDAFVSLKPYHIPGRSFFETRFATMTRPGNLNTMQNTQQQGVGCFRKPGTGGPSCATRQLTLNVRTSASAGTRLVFKIFGRVWSMPTDDDPRLQASSFPVYSWLSL